MDDNSALRILIADDNESDRLILQAIVRKQGYEVVTAADGVEAVAQFRDSNPQIVLLDALMPNMDGFDAARQIKQLAGEELVPIIFLTSLSDAPSLAKCLEAGGDDFLSKPYNQVILQAKISAFNRMRMMHATLQRQRDQIAANNKQLLREQEVAKTVFDNVAHLGCLNASNIRHILSPLSVFNGDVLLACRKPSGGMHVLLGDFTGHGLPAAIGAMPLAEIFYGMTNKGFALKEVIREINQKLKSILPVGFFCCAGFVDLNFIRRDMEVWLGGLPDSFIKRADGSLQAVSSNHLPLGVLDDERFTMDTYTFELAEGERFFMWSDGIIEARNRQDEMFGESRLVDILRQPDPEHTVFYAIQQAVEAFIGGGLQAQDDLTLIELTMDDAGAAQQLEPMPVVTTVEGPQDWSFSVQLRGKTLQQFNPMPLLLHLLSQIPDLRGFSGDVYTVLNELFSNALEHGVLKLDSGQKATPEGFIQYYQEREQRLKQLGAAEVTITIDHEPSEAGGLLAIEVSDSGHGFDLSKLERQALHHAGYSGRGIPLIRRLCDEVTFTPPGNRVRVLYHWRRHDNPFTANDEVRH